MPKKAYHPQWTARGSSMAQSSNGITGRFFDFLGLYEILGAILCFILAWWLT